VESQPVANTDSEVPDATQTADSNDVSAPAEPNDACAEDTPATTANGPVDEVLLRIHRIARI